MNSSPNENTPVTAEEDSGLYGLWEKFVHLVDRSIPEDLAADPESFRHARLITRFAILGTASGLAFTIFYLLIGHYWGALIVFLCTTGVCLTPAVMRSQHSIPLAGNFFCLTLVLGFLSLSFVEGGIHGHAIAWLVSIPLCALLLLGREQGIRWTIISVTAAAVVASLDLAGVTLPITYDPRWAPVISTAGYLALLLFMFFLGLAFENGRRQAYLRMQQAIEELAATNERLVYLNNEKTEFLGIAAHDLRAPLTVILGNAELLQIYKEDPAQAGQLREAIVISAERMRDLINNLLDVNTIEEGKYASNIEKCDLGLLTRQCVEYNLPNAARKQIRIDTARVVDVFAAADNAAAAQILDNLLSNAIKYSPYNTTICVSAGRDQKKAFISVRDEGPGISEEDQKKLFQKYSRLSARPTGGESSTGLGLAIVKRLAEAMAGTIRCDSTLGSGTTFTLLLPFLPGGATVKKPATATARLRWASESRKTGKTDLTANSG